MSIVYHVRDKLHVAGKPHVTKTCFPIEVCKQITIANCMNNLKETSYVLHPRGAQKHNPRTNWGVSRILP